MTKFNPFEYILVLEECLISPQLYKEKEESFKKFMECVEKNKDNDKFIEIVEKELNKKNGGATKSTGSTVDTPLTIKEVDDNISAISDDVKTMFEKTLNKDQEIDQTIFELSGLIINAKKEKDKDSVKIKNIMLLINYGLKYLLECQTILQSKDDLQNINELTIIIKILSQTIKNVKKYEGIPPDDTFKKLILKFIEASHAKISKLSIFLNTKYEDLNLITSKAIMSLSVIMCAMIYLNTEETGTKYIETNRESKKILQNDINIINGISPIPISGNDSDINKLIKDTISILNKKCKPDHMMDTFIYVLNMIETK